MSKSTVTDDRIVHFLGPLTAFGRVRSPGEKLTVTPAMFEESVDVVTQSSWLDLTPGDQRAKWGEEMFTDDDSHPALVNRRLAEEARQTPTRAKHDDPMVDALMNEWEREDRLRAQGGSVQIRSRTIWEPRP